MDSMAQLAKHMGDFMRMYQEMVQAKEEILGSLTNIQKGERGPQGLAGMPGRDGRDGKDGKNGRDGKDGTPGLNGRDGKIPKIEDIVKEVRKKKLKTEDIDGLDQTISAFKTQLDNRGGYIHGGGDTVGAGSGISITNVNGTKIISATGSGAVLTAETPVGAVDGSNLVYTVLNEPVFVEIDGMIRVNGFGYTYLAGTITVDALTPPSQSIVSFYNS